MNAALDLTGKESEMRKWLEFGFGESAIAPDDAGFNTSSMCLPKLSNALTES